MSCTISDDISAFQYLAEKSINTQMLSNCRSWRIEIVIVSDQMFNKLHLHYIRIRSEIILAVNVVIEKIFKDVLFKSILCLPSCSCSYLGNPILGLNNLEKYTINVLFFVSLQRFLREIFNKKTAV